jgi:CheY-like chemotaxis protein
VLIDAGTSSAIDLPAPPLAGTRSIVVLAPAARGDLQLLHESGFATYLVKPVRQISLVNRIRALPDAEPASHPGAHRVGPVEFEARYAQSAKCDRRLKILVAEDNPINALLARELLQRRGHTVTEVPSGEGALAAMQDQGFDLVLMDLHMPGLDGVEAARRIRTAEAAAGRLPTPVVALTADVLEAGRQACQDAGMDGFLSKPIDPAELDDMIAQFFPGKLRAAAE